MASISFNNVTKRFGDTVAVNNVSFDIADNEFFCLFGPPLSGKSTILKLILGLEKPDEGEILIDGKPVNHVSLGAAQCGDGVPEPGAVSPYDRRAECPLSARRTADAGKRDRSAGSPMFRRNSTSATSCTSLRRNCQAVNGSGWRSRARWCAIPSPI